MAKVKNKNYQRIDNLIVSAFRELIKTQSVDKISVTSLCAKANVNRTTFYKHYADTSEIIDKLEYEIIIKLFKMFEDVTLKEFCSNSLYYLRKCNEYILSDIDLCKQIFRPSRVRFIVDKSNEYIYKSIETKDPKVISQFSSPCQLKTQIGFIIGATTNLYLQWFRGFIECPLDNISQTIAKNISCISTRIREELSSKQTNKK